jgi:methylase of polypeptide subunit release factors
MHLVRRLAKAACDGSLEQAKQEIRWLQRFATDRRAQSPDASQAQARRLTAYVNQRIEQHKPLQFILGSQPFCGLEIRVRPPILIPRQVGDIAVFYMFELFIYCNHRNILIFNNMIF